MPLTAGSRVGPYIIDALLGAGGMGEVYRARDTRLDRDVAIKVLPDLFAVDRDRLARLEREAKALAALNHPNVAQIYGIEDTGATRAIVMELVEGEDLAERLGRRIASGSGALSSTARRQGLPLDDALSIAQQVIEALECAHDAGIVHRDLKPANIKLRPDGQVKVLDFGLAKALEPELSGTAVSAMHSPTLTARGTAMGMIIGTAAYMSPEQAKGRPVDRRADIWAFGIVLYEMLTGRACFGGDGVGDILASVIKDAPDLDALPQDVPAGVRRLLARCLEKDPRRRLSAIGDARWDLEDASAPAAAPSARTARARALGWVPWAIAATAAAAALLSWARQAPAVAPTATLDGHFTIELPHEAPVVTSDIPRSADIPVAVSPDGRTVVYVAPNGRGTQLFARGMADLAPRPIAGSDGARSPFLSPDGQWVGFFAGGKLKKIPLAGGTPATLADAPQGYGGSWGDNGEIVFAPDTRGLFSVRDAGGTPRQVTSLAPGDDLHVWPQRLPGSPVVLFTVLAWSRETTLLVAVNLDTGARSVVQEEAAFARYVPGTNGSAGHVAFVRDGALMIGRFDPAHPGHASPAVTVLDGLDDRSFDVSSTGVLVYAPGTGKPVDYSLVWVDRAGNATTINDLPRGYEDLNLSPDGRVVALTVEESGPESPASVWLADVTRRTLSRFTFDGFSRDPVWAADGQSIVFGGKRGENSYGLYVQRLDGRTPAELVWASPVPIWPDPSSWTPDGRTIIFSTSGEKTRDDIYTLSLDSRTLQPWLATAAVEYSGRLSPDGRWIAYASDESGRTEVYVQPFPGPGAKHLVSQGGGQSAIWSRDGREIFYRRDDEVFVSQVETAGTFSTSTPSLMFAGRYRATGRDYDASHDGKRFVMMRANDSRTTDRLRVVLNWRSLTDGTLPGR